MISFDKEVLSFDKLDNAIVNIERAHEEANTKFEEVMSALREQRTQFALLAHVLKELKNEIER